MHFNPIYNHSLNKTLFNFYRLFSVCLLGCLVCCVSFCSCSLVSVICCCFRDGQQLSARGECPGILAHGPTGDGGFGYDPIFYLPELGKTMAQLTPEEKNKISHRAKALAGFQKEWEKQHGTDQ